MLYLCMLSWSVLSANVHVYYTSCKYILNSKQNSHLFFMYISHEKICMWKYHVFKSIMIYLSSSYFEWKMKSNYTEVFITFWLNNCDLTIEYVGIVTNSGITLYHLQYQDTVIADFEDNASHTMNYLHSSFLFSLVYLHPMYK